MFGRPIGQNQGVQFPIARAHVQIDGRGADGRTARPSCSMPGEPCGTEANMAKLLASEASWYAADMCLQTHGGFGFAEEYDIERKFRETRLYQVAPISTNLILSPRGDARAGPAEVVLTRGALDGILVVALEQAVAAPFCTSPAGRCRRAGDQDRAPGRRFRPRLRRTSCTARAPISSGSTAARNRSSSTSRTRPTRRCCARLIARADVFVQNLAPGAAERAGFGSDELARALSAADHLRYLRLRRGRARTAT